MTIQHLRSSTANKRPTAGAMSDGQLAVNTNATNPGLFFKDANGDIRKVGPVFVGTSAPNSSPATGGSTGHGIGEQWLDSSGGVYQLKIWDGTAWRNESVLIGTSRISDDAVTADKLADTAVTAGTYTAADITVDAQGRITAAASGTIGTAEIADDAVTGAKLANDITIANDLTVSNNLIVNGTTTTINSTTLTVDDKNIELGSVSTPSDTTADGGGITLKGATDKTLTWVNSTGCWTFNQPMDFNAHVRIDSSGRLGVNTSSPSSYYANKVVIDIGSSAQDGLTIASGTSAQAMIAFADGTGGSARYSGYIDYNHSSNALSFGTNGGVEHFRIASNGDLTATDTTIGSNSDSRLKTNIANFTYSLETFKQYQAKTFDWKNPQLHGDRPGQRGFIAQDVEVIDSYWVSEQAITEDSADTAFLDEDRMVKTLKLGKKDAMYISVIQQLVGKVETLEAKVAALEAA